MTSREASPDTRPLRERRPRLGTASARSTLLTVLGEFVHPSGEAVWTATLVAALSALDVEEKAARQALTRTAAEGILESARHGRRVLWRLTPDGKALLEEGTRHIYGFMRDRRTWDGRWLVVTIAIPESKRGLRHRVRTRLTWLGLGNPTPGLWVSPDASKAPSVSSVVADLGLEELAFAWAGPIAGVGDERRLLARAWDLEGVERRYQAFLEDFAHREAVTDTDAFVAQLQMIEEWRRFPFADPDLPLELLDHDWPGPRAAGVFHERHRHWDEAARRAWERFDAAGGDRP